jgi:plasmid stabilization system protein ParE
MGAVRIARRRVSPPCRLLLSPRAVADLEEIAAYIARDNPVRAPTFIDALEAQCVALARTPLGYPPREDLASRLRMGVHGRYLILFRLLSHDDAVRVERVLYGA